MKLCSQNMKSQKAPSSIYKIYATFPYLDQHWICFLGVDALKWLELSVYTLQVRLFYVQEKPK